MRRTNGAEEQDEEQGEHVDARVVRPLVSGAAGRPVIMGAIASRELREEQLGRYGGPWGVD